MSWLKDAADVVKAAGEAVNQSGVVDKIGNAISAMANSLGIAAKHVYEVLVRQAVVDSVTNVLLYIFFFVLIFAFARLGVYMGTKDPRYDHSGTPDNGAAIGRLMSFIASGLSIVVLFFFFINTITATVTGFVNPEYKAITAISEMIKTQTNNGGSK